MSQPSANAVFTTANERANAMIRGGLPKGTIAVLRLGSQIEGMAVNGDISIVVRRVRRLTESDAAQLGAESRRAWVSWAPREAARQTAEALVQRARPTPSNMWREIEQAWQTAAWAAHPEIPAGAWLDCAPPVDEDWVLALQVAYEAALGILVAHRDPAIAGLLVEPWRAVVGMPRWQRW